MLNAAGHRIEFPRRPRHARAAGEHGPRHDRPQQLRASGIIERLKHAAERIHQAVAAPFRRAAASLNVGGERVVGDLAQQRIGRADGRR